MRLTLHGRRQRPLTELTWDGETLTATDAASGESVRMTGPSSIYHYDYDESHPVDRRVTGLAVLDADGLVLADLPGEWNPQHVRGLGVPVLDGGRDRAARARTMLAGRAPGWRRLRGVPRGALHRWRVPLVYGGALITLAATAYLVSVGGYVAWRVAATVFRAVVDHFEVKWLGMALSPALLAFRPVREGLLRLRTRTGKIAGPLSVRGEWLRLGHDIPDVALERLNSLLIYQHEDLRGLFLLDHGDRPLRHIPGPWRPEALRRFTERHGLRLAVHRISRQEYLDLVRACPQALP
ncbi:hypothetical protein [Nonomuraea sp. NPDC049725]|uniref:hypothetical protein n=1 Tax=Nonomuraea sp. NPDC049725 TaxID=3154508 RepID=UPI00343D6A29